MRQLGPSNEEWPSPEGGQLCSAGRQEEAQGHWVKMTGEVRGLLEMETFNKAQMVTKIGRWLVRNTLGLPGGTVVKNLAASIRGAGDTGSFPELGRSLE